MKLFFLICVGFFASSAFGQVKKNLCPEILSASNLSHGLSRDELTEYFDAVDEGILVKAIPDAVLTQSALTPGEKSSVYTIRIEEVNPKTGIVGKTLSLNCPLVRDWLVETLPAVAFRKWEGHKALNEPARPGQAQTLERNGLRLVKLFHDSEAYFSISLLWDLHQDVKTKTLELPSFVKEANLKRTHLKVDPSRIPARALRLTTTGKFGNVWYLLTPDALKKVGSLELLSPFEKRDEAERGRAPASIDFLDYYDSLNGRLFPCSHILAKTEEGNCLFYNSSLHPELLQIMKTDEPIWVQVVLQLDKGFIVQTYRLADDPEAEPILIEQSFMRDLTEFNITPGLLP